MEKRKCIRCKAELPVEANFCPNCGYEVPISRPPIDLASLTPKVIKGISDALGLLGELATDLKGLVEAHAESMRRAQEKELERLKEESKESKDKE